MMKDYLFEEIYLIGIVDIENDTAEFVASDMFMYFEFGKQFLEIEAIDSFGRLRITIVERLRTDFGFENVPSGKVKVGQIVFMNPMANHTVESVVFYNLEVIDEGIISDVLLIKLTNGEDLFVDPQYLGITIGGLQQKHLWEEQYRERVLTRVGEMPFETYIKIQ
ncbi:hypothetical protein [Paenibacillus paridis]|uniref:hypothetical protein n=1 Tax=Paenibacillus paridis TaxID=2583376 RepID=UPI001124748C|nr:hypothetical protein [Paenibacillus paridis]